MNKFIWIDGIKVTVLRPTNAVLAVEITKSQIGNNNPNFLQQIEEKCGPLIFIGFLGRSFYSSKHFIVNDKLEKIGELVPGDFFSQRQE